jgi:hypothetical protein
MYGVDIPCPHQFALGARRPILLDVELDIETERKEIRPANYAYFVRRLQPDVWTRADLRWLLPRNSLKRTFTIFSHEAEETGAS